MLSGLQKSQDLLHLLIYKSCQQQVNNMKIRRLVPEILFGAGYLQSRQTRVVLRTSHMRHLAGGTNVPGAAVGGNDRLEFVDSRWGQAVG